MMASVVNAYCWLSGPSIRATSSLSPSAPGPASGAKKRAMRSNSPRRGGAPTLFLSHSLGPERPGESVEHGIDEPGLLAGEERMRDIEILADRDARRHVGPGQELVGTGAQDRAQNDLEPFERPIGRKRRDNVPVE